MNSSTPPTILVTGISGFIAQHCALRLLERGYRVRGTLRSPAREAKVRETLGKHAKLGDRLEFCTADLTRDVGWAEAVRGCEGVLHVASPLPRQAPKHEDELIAPARDGALRVLRAASENAVKRVVMTSSVAAVIYGHRRDGSEIYDESHWSILGGDLGAYEKSKTIAEHAAWDFVKSLPEERRPEFAVINPGFVLGPILDDDYGTSGELIKKLLNREIPGCPDIGYAMVDVRDVADAHVAALEKSDAVGKRFICAIEQASLLDVARILDKHFAAKGFRVPTRRIPDWLLRVVALFDKTTRLVVPELHKRQDLDTTLIRRVLEWKPRSLETMVVDMAESMIEHGVVRSPG